MVRALTGCIVVLAGAGSRSIGVALRDVVAPDEALLTGIEGFQRTTARETDQNEAQWQVRLHRSSWEIAWRHALKRRVASRVARAMSRVALSHRPGRLAARTAMRCHP